MAWFYNRLHVLLRWLWGRLGLMCRPIVGYAFAAIGWREDDKRQEKPESSEPPQRSFPECEGQHEDEAEPSAEEDEDQDEDQDQDEDEDEFDSQEYRVETSDALYCAYDSTWDTEEPQEGEFNTTCRPPAFRHYKFSRFESAARDMQNYRHKYPSQTRRQHWMKPISDDKPNLKFYLGQTPSVPDGVYIHDFHDKWAGAYETLERVHTYIQWLFPLQEPGVNYEASPLTTEEIEDFLQSSVAKENLLKSYKLMLDFYGMELLDESTGEVQRSSNWPQRFSNLNRNTHNNLRITRILKCQGVLGYPHYQAPLVWFFLKETLVNGQLPNVRDSVLNYFVFAVLDKRQRRSLLKFAFLNYDRRDEFVWCPKKIQMKWSRLSEAREAEDTMGELTDQKMCAGESDEDF
ncbi:opioid growth factor receptor-like [Pempheris klunzingeri]|uniref:opioid growth factor receptor-like n=1 Tax=Pempheris klunzingeri TaxID=3127111 RepID=UPI00397FCD39